MKRLLTTVLTLAVLAMAAHTALGFCGFYVAKADTRLFNQASQVVLARDGDRTVLTMANDFKGDPKEFAIVIPVPTFLQKEQIHVGEQSLIDHLDAFTAPRLVEYFDENPCQRYDTFTRLAAAAGVRNMREADAVDQRARSLGVSIEAKTPGHAQHGIYFYKSRLGTAEQLCTGGVMELRPWLAGVGRFVRSVHGEYRNR